MAVVPEHDIDPRIERSRTRVLRAALGELAERGYGGFTIDSVAARSGVARSTIYRHWPDKLALVTDALDVLNRQPPPAPNHETPNHETPNHETPIDRVRTLLTHLATSVHDTDVGRCLPALIEASEHSPELRELSRRYSATRRRALVDAVRAGVASGDFPAATDPELASQALAGAIVYRRLLTDERFTDDEISDLIALVLRRSA